MQKPVLVGTIIASLLVGAASGFSLGKTTGSGGPGMSLEERNRAYQEGYDKAKNDVNDIFVAKGLSYPLDYEITDVFGKVVEVGPSGFVVEYDTAQFTVLDKGMARKSVTLASGAVVKRMQDAPKGSPADVTADTAPRGSLGKLEVPSEDPREAAPPPTQPAKATPPPADAPGSLPQMAVAIVVGDLKAGDYVHLKTDGSAKADGALVATEVTVLNVKATDSGEAPKFTDLPFARSYGKADGQEPPGPSSPQ